MATVYAPTWSVVKTNAGAFLTDGAFVSTDVGGGDTPDSDYPEIAESEDIKIVSAAGPAGENTIEDNSVVNDKYIFDGFVAYKVGSEEEKPSSPNASSTYSNTSGRWNADECRAYVDLYKETASWDDGVAFAYPGITIGPDAFFSNAYLYAQFEFIGSASGGFQDEFAIYVLWNGWTGGDTGYIQADGSLGASGTARMFSRATYADRWDRLKIEWKCGTISGNWASLASDGYVRIYLNETGSADDLICEITNADLYMTQQFEVLHHQAAAIWVGYHGMFGKAANVFLEEVAPAASSTPECIEYTTFTKQAGTGNQTITGASFQPKALVLWSSRQTSTGATDGVDFTIGMTDGTDRMTRFIKHPDNEAATTSAQSERTNRLVYQTDATSGSTPTVQNEADFVAFTSDGFTIDWTTNDGAADIYHCLIIGGADVSVDYVPVKMNVGAGGIVSVTSMSFQPESFIVIGGAADETGAGDYNLGAPYGSVHGLGFSNGAGNICAWTLGRGTAGASDTNKGQHGDRVASIRTANVTGAEDLCSVRIVGVRSNGFNVERLTAPYPSLQPIQHILAIKGIRFSFGEFSVPASTGAYTLPVPFAAETVLFQTDGTTDGATDGMGLAIGGWSNTGATGGTWIGGNDAANPSVYAKATYDDAAISYRTPNATGSSSAVAIAATITSVSNSAVEMSFSAVSAATMQYVAAACSEPIEAEFENADVTIGLTWMILTARNGTQYVWSDRPLPDPSTYYLGWKEPRVLRWDRIRRALSHVLDGQYETTDFRVALDDTDRLMRTLDENAQLVNATVAVYMIDDEGRRALETPRTVYRGVVRDAIPQGTLAYELVMKDTFAEQFSTTNTTNLVPRRVILAADFPAAGDTRVKSSAEGYVVDGVVAAGESDVPVKTGWGIFANGDVVSFGGDGTQYAVQSASSQFVTAGVDTETYITVTPALVNPLSDNDTVVLYAVHDVEPTVGKRVPFYYGRITDYAIDGGVDAGDGQGVALFVGDRVLGDGKRYGEFLWSGHACYSPSDRPIQMLYFWNSSVDNYGNGIFFPDIDTLANEADAGGRLCVPGYGNWTTTNGFTNSYRDFNGRRYTVFYMRGVFRDWALGIAPPPPNLGGIQFAVNAYGCETVGDGTGTLITSGMQQYKHIVKNWCPPQGDGYQSGAWLASPAFADDATLPMINEASFDTAEAQAAIYQATGAVGDFGVGVNNEEISARDLLARLNLSFGVECGFNRKTQFFVTMVNRTLATTTLQPTLTYVRDIFAGQFKIVPATTDLYTAISFRHSPDYYNRAQDGWRSVLTGTVEVENVTASTTIYGAKTTYSTMELHMIQGKNRSSDPVEHQAGTDWAAAVLAIKLARLSMIQHIVGLMTGPKGFNYELGDVVPVTHYEGLGPNGWTDEPIRIERIEIDPSEYVTVLEGYSLTPILL